jgi:hypothetical protein
MRKRIKKKNREGDQIEGRKEGEELDNKHNWKEQEKT